MQTAPLHKVTLRLSNNDLANVRFAISPLWECVSAFKACLDPSRHALLLPWTTKVRSRIAGIDWEPLTLLASLPRGSIPDFLVSQSITPLPVFADEIASLQQTSARVVSAEIRVAYRSGVPRPLQSAIADPSAFVVRIASLLEKFWERALAPEWPVLRCKLEAEVLFRARALALGGAEALFEGMHRDVSYGRGLLTVHTDSHWDEKTRKRGVLIVPSIFSWPDVFLTVRPPWRPTIYYTSRGVGHLWGDDRHATQNGTPSELLGRTCAKIMVALESPATTMETAKALRLSTAAASEQITKLWRCGCLDRTRIGLRVFYALNTKGRTLLADLES